MLRIVNTSDKPVEFTWNSENYGPYPPGAIVELPDEVAYHAIRRNQVLDDAGMPVGSKMDLLSNVINDKRVMERVRYSCPLVATGECQATDIESKEALLEHMKTHEGGAKNDQKKEGGFMFTGRKS